MKNKSLIIISILFCLLLVPLGFILFQKNPEWENNFISESEEYLYNNLYKLSDEKFVGSFWIFDTFLSKEKIYLTPYNNTKRITQIEIDVNKVKVFEEIRMKEIIEDSLSPVFLSMQLSVERKNLWDKVSCLYLNKESCKRDVSISQLDIYNNRYPYPTLSEKDSKELAIYSIELIEKSTNLPTIDEAKCSELMSEYVYKSSKGLDSDQTLKTFKETDCTDIYALLSYSKIIENSEPLYPEIKEKLCGLTDSIDIEYLDTIIKNSDVNTFKEICSIEGELKGIEVELNDDISFTSQRILDILSKKKESNFDEIKIDMLNFLSGDVFTTWESPYCENLYLCNMELINLSKIILEK